MADAPGPSSTPAPSPAAPAASAPAATPPASSAPAATPGTPVTPSAPAPETPRSMVDALRAISPRQDVREAASPAPDATAPPTPGAPPAAPATAEATAETVTPAGTIPPADAIPADKRLADTQAWGHRLKGTLDRVLADPEIGARARALVNGQAPADPAALPPAAPPAQPPAPRAPTPPGTVVPEVAEAYRKYNEAPSEEAAFAVLLAEAEARAEARVMATLEARATKAREARAAEQARLQAAHDLQGRQQTVRDQVDQILTTEYADVDPDLFWALGARQAEREVPAHLTDPTERLRWQISRAAEIVRAKQTKFTGPASKAAAETVRLQTNAAAVMAGGGATPPAAAGTTAPPKSMVEQMRELRPRGAGVLV